MKKLMISDEERKARAKEQNAKRQAKYRASRETAKHGDGERCIHAYVDTLVFHTLERLSLHYELTQKDTLEKVIRDAEKAVKEISGGSDTEAWAKYEENWRKKHGITESV